MDEKIPRDDQRDNGGSSNPVRGDAAELPSEGGPWLEDLEELIGLIGVPLRNAAPGPYATPYAERRSRHNARYPYAAAAVKTAIRAVELARRYYFEERDDLLGELAEDIERLHEAAFMHGVRAAPKGQRLLVLSKVDKAAKYGLWMRTVRALALRRLGRAVPRSDKRLLLDESCENYRAAVAKVDEVPHPDQYEEFAQVDNARIVEDCLLLVRVQEDAPTVDARLRKHAELVRNVLVAWMSGRGQWSAAQKLFKALALSTNNQEAYKAEWSKFKATRRARRERRSVSAQD